MLEGSDELIGRAFTQGTKLDEEFMDAKDYFYNIGKSLDIPTIMESKIYRAELFEIFYSFIDAEY